MQGYKVYIKKELKFEAAHRLLNYQGKCSNIHGHNTKMWVYARPKNGELDSLGMVVDFKEIKSSIGDYIDKCFDHAILLNIEDTETRRIFQQTNFKVFLLPGNPTAENIALFLLIKACPELLKDASFEVFKIEVYENDSSVAVAELV